MKILHLFEVRDLGTPTRLKVRVMQHDYKWIRGQRESTRARENGSNLKIAL